MSDINNSAVFEAAAQRIPAIPKAAVVAVNGQSAKAAGFLEFLIKKISAAQAAEKRSVEVDRNGFEAKGLSVYGDEMNAVDEALTAAGYQVRVHAQARSPHAPAPITISW